MKNKFFFHKLLKIKYFLFIGIILLLNNCCVVSLTPKEEKSESTLNKNNDSISYYNIVFENKYRNDFYEIYFNDTLFFKGILTTPKKMSYGPTKGFIINQCPDSFVLVINNRKIKIFWDNKFHFLYIKKNFIGIIKVIKSKYFKGYM